MQRSIFSYLYALMGIVYLVVSLGSVSYSQTKFPLLTGYVNDTAHLLDNETIESLTKKLAMLEKKTGDQIVIVTIPTLLENDIETYSNSLFRTWRLGQKQINNGVLLVIAPNERAVRIEVGYGLEGKLTDAISAVIIDNFVLPNFRKGNYKKGIVEAINAIISVIGEIDSDFTYRIKAKAKAAEVQRKQAEKNEMIANIIIFLIFFTVISLPIFAMIFGKKIGSQKYLWLGITFTPWFLNLGDSGKRSNGGFVRNPSKGRFRGGGGSSGGGGATGRW